MAFLRFQKLRNIRGADLHFQRRGDAVKRLHALAGDVLRMLVKVDEAGGDDETGRMNDALAL